MIGWHEILLRLLFALLCSGLVGIERFHAGKSAGVRTHVLIGLGSALFTLVSGYAFGATASNADRIAAQVVTGIGFLGGGAILREGTTVRGLTTAAGMWAVAALGMAAGAGLYTIGSFGTAIILITVVGLRWAERYLPRRIVETWLIRITLAEGAEIEAIRQEVLRDCDLVTIEAVRFDEHIEITLSADASHPFDVLGLTERLRAAGAKVISWQAHESADLDRGL